MPSHCSFALVIAAALSSGSCLRPIALPEGDEVPTGVLAAFISFEEPLRTGSGKGSTYVHDPSLAELYLSTLRDTLTGSSLKTPRVTPQNGSAVQQGPFVDGERDEGRVWCEFCYTMVGNARLSHVRELLERTMAEGVAGDFVETGIWRGGTSIFARAVQRINGQGAERRVYACDSFSGVPQPSTPMDSDWFHGARFLEVPLEDVRDHFERFQMLDKNVVFVKGYFQNSLPALRARLLHEDRSIAVLRGDADLFESYYDILYNLYDLIPVGGYFVCDDCPNVFAAQMAVSQFRSHHGIKEPQADISGSASGSYWRKERDVRVDYEKYLRWNATRNSKLS